MRRPRLRGCWVLASEQRFHDSRQTRPGDIRFCLRLKVLRSGRWRPAVRIRDVVRGHSTTSYSGEFDRKFGVADGDILIGMDGEFNRARWQGGPALLNQRVCKITASDPQLEEGYLFHLLPRLLQSIEDATPFVTVKHLSVKTLLAARFYLPPLSEQRRIAATLDQAGNLLGLAQQTLATIDHLLLAEYSSRFGTFEATKTPSVPLSSVLESIDSGSSPVCLPRSAEHGEWGVLKLSAISQGTYLAEQNKAIATTTPARPDSEVRVGDVLFSRKNTTQLVATSAYVWSTPGRRLLPDLIFRLVPNPELLNGLFLQRQVSHPPVLARLRALAGGSSASMSNISKDKLGRFEIVLPPLEEQETFAAAVMQLEQRRGLAQKQMTTIEFLLESFQSSAFSGSR